MKSWNGGKNDGTPHKSEHMYLGTITQHKLTGRAGIRYRADKYSTRYELPDILIYARVNYGLITKEDGERILRGKEYPRSELNAPSPKSDHYTEEMITRYNARDQHDTGNVLGKIQKILSFCREDTKVEYVRTLLVIGEVLVDAIIFLIFKVEYLGKDIWVYIESSQRPSNLTSETTGDYIVGHFWSEEDTEIYGRNGEHRQFMAKNSMRERGALYEYSGH